MSQRPERVYEFGPFRLHVVKRLLVRDGKVVPVTRPLGESYAERDAQLDAAVRELVRQLDGRGK